HHQFSLVTLIQNHKTNSFHLQFLCFCCCHFLRLFRQELANSQQKNPEDSENKNQRVVLALYDALKSRDVETVHKILAPDLEWWFHGPPTHQFMMHLLTGSTTASSASQSSFVFVPLSITSFGPIVLAEGCDHSRQISWVHAWTVADGIITQVREYFNTSLTVTRFGKDLSGQSQRKKSPPSDFPSTAEINPVHCPSVWESSVSNRDGKSVPGLVLAL
ncbi:hypothetical protein CICLE_v10033519mg, partial [Citrus x clementina]